MRPQVALISFPSRMKLRRDCRMGEWKVRAMRWIQTRLWISKCGQVSTCFSSYQQCESKGREVTEVEVANLWADNFISPRIYSRRRNFFYVLFSVIFSWAVRRAAINILALGQSKGKPVSESARASGSGEMVKWWSASASELALVSEPKNLPTQKWRTFLPTIALYPSLTIPHFLTSPPRCLPNHL